MAMTLTQDDIDAIAAAILVTPANKLATGLVWSLKALHATSASTLLAVGTVNVLGQATMAVA